MVTVYVSISICVIYVLLQTTLKKTVIFHLGVLGRMYNYTDTHIELISVYKYGYECNMEYVKLQELPNLCSAIYGELHAIVMQIFNMCTLGMHDVKIKESTHISNDIVTEILSDLYEGGIILFADWFWVPNSKIVLAECCPPEMLDVLHVRVVQALRINFGRRQNSAAQVRKQLKLRQRRSGAEFKKRKKKAK